jgi:sugar phosphate isomerase/epimerase
LWERKEEIVEALRHTSIKASVLCPRQRGCFLAADKEERKLAVSDLKRSLELASEIGAIGVITIPIFGRRPRLPDLSPLANALQLEHRLMVEILGGMGKYSQKLGSLVLLEPLNRYEAHFLNRLEDAIELCEEIGSEGIKIMADFFHMNIEEEEIAQSIECAGEYIQHIHLADSNRLLPGYGHTNFAAGFAALSRVGFDKYMSLECRIPGDARIELPKCAQYLRRIWNGQIAPAVKN